jgi:hypothetical protein
MIELGGGKAGGSAQRELERRRARDGARRRQRWGLWLAVTLATPVLVFVGLRLGVPAMWEYTGQTMRSSADGLEDMSWEPLPDDTLNLLAGAGAFAATVSVCRAGWGRRRSTEAWGIGAGGERRTARDLDRLGTGYHLFHDLRLPDSRANIDHLVIGPTGVFTVETKHRKATVVVGRRGVTCAGRTMRPAVDQARRQATAVSTALGVAVRPVVAIQGGRLEVRGWRTRPIVDGVRFCTGRQLPKVLSAGSACLTADQVAALHHRASVTFAPA